MVDGIYSQIMPQVAATEINTSRKIKQAAKDVLEEVTNLLENKYNQKS